MSVLDIERQFDFLRQNLLDLTMRNQLLNFRPGTRTIEVVDEIPTEIYNILILKEKKREREMQFLAKPGSDDDVKELREKMQDALKGKFIWKLADIEITGKEELNEEEIKFTEALIKVEQDEKDKNSVLWELPAPTEDVADKHKDLFLQTKLSGKELQKRLFYINQQAKSVLEEQGYNILYLALGFLKWKEMQGVSGYRKAPLILIPVELDRKRVKGSFKLRWTGEDVVTNISLHAKLKEQGMEIPDFEMPETKEGVYEYLQKIEEIISPQKEWKVTYEIFLGFFSFTKFVMYKDLDPERWPSDNLLAESPVIQEIFNPSDELTDHGFDENAVDMLLSSDETFHVVDADSSQIAVIEDVKNGHNMVVEGPPGTGKSQTIVNLISELMAAGNTVLFVSEKMAALEVVKNRLDRIGLGEFCLELHSRKANKKEVLNELETTINNTRDIGISLEEEFHKLEDLKSDLNNYVKFLHKPYGKIEFTPFYLFGLKEKSLQHFDNSNRKLPRFDFNNPNMCSIDDWNSAYSKLKETSELLKLVKPISKNPWRLCNPDPILPVDQEEIEILTGKSTELLGRINSKFSYLAQITGINYPESLNKLDESLYTAKLISNSKLIEKEVLLNDQWNSENNSSDKIIEDIEKFNSIISKYNPDVIEKDIPYFINRYKECSDNLFKVQSSSLNSVIGTIDENLDKTIGNFVNLKSRIDYLIRISGVKSPETFVELNDILVTAESIANSITVEKEVLLNNRWNSENPEAYKLIKDLENFNKYETRILARIDKAILDEDIRFLLEEYKRQSSKLLKFMSGEFKRLKSNIDSFYKNEMPSSNDAVISDLEELLRCQKVRDEIRSNEISGKNLFGYYWNAEKTDTQFLIEFTQWIISFRKLIIENKITEQALDIVSSGANSQEIEKTISDITQSASGFIRSLNELNNYLYIDYNLEDTNFMDLNSTLKSLRGRIDEYTKIKSDIQSFYKLKLPMGDDILLKDLEELLKCKNLRTDIRNNELGKNLFGSYWDYEKSDTSILVELSKWLTEFKKLLFEGKITEQALDIVSSGANSQEIEKTISKIHSIKEEIINSIIKLDNYLHFKEDIKELSIDNLNSQLNLYHSEIQSLPSWSQFVLIRKEVKKTIAHNIIEIIDLDKLESDDILPCFEGNFADSLLRNIFSDIPAISSFVGNLHEKKISAFQELDNKLIALNRLRIIRDLYNSRPPLYSSASPRSELGILKSEFARKRGHMPLRKLFLAVGSLIQKIKPCFMMSPLSVAQFLDPDGINNMRFDYVVFDEASQVKPEDALGALLRANKAVVMGDTKQLPPTSFFDAMADKDENLDYELSSISDMESILHLCKRSFPTKMLKWHYRSRHESLIAVSNQEFYSNELLIYPSPCHDSENLGLKFVYLPDTVYDRGNSATNRKEAAAVVQAAFEHYKKYGNKKSLGIGTFNVRQQQAILEELELQLKLNPQMEEFFTSNHDEHFFVKNLETIQGDERDVILVSIGYGFDSDHRLSLNFGPLNHDGGERRLNVLVTRAREQCIIFANFKGRDIEIRPNAPFGLRALKVFLEYADTKNLQSINGPGEDTESPFEDSVYEFLTNSGYNVHKQVGCAAFRIDLAIVDPKHPGRYLIGIECDGAMYHSSPVARDRDRLRQQVLEGLGWTFHRIWSTDWYRNRIESQNNLINAIEETKNNKGIKKQAINSNMNKAIEENEIIKKEIKSAKKIKSKSLEDEINPYKTCDSLRILVTGELHEKPVRELSRAVVQIVTIEGPIHKEEVIKRIRSFWGVKRAGKRIKDALSNAMQIAASYNEISIKNDFLYLKDQEVSVRRREKGQPLNINLICDEEIIKAVTMVIEHQFATPPEELIKQVAKLFGIKVIRAATAERIDNVIKGLIDKGELEQTTKGMINFPQ